MPLAQPSKRRGRPAKDAISTYPSSSTESSVILCTWIPRPDGWMSVELWQYLLPPEEKIASFQLCDKIWDLNLDLQAFVVVGSRLFLLGYAGPDGPPPQDATFNICTEILLGKQLVRCLSPLIWLHFHETILFSQTP